MEQVALVFWLVISLEGGNGEAIVLPVPYDDLVRCEIAAEHYSEWEYDCIPQPVSDIQKLKVPSLYDRATGK